MGLIQKIFGGIFGFIAGLFGSIAKVFGLGKSGFYMELSDDESAAAASQAVDATPKTAEPVAMKSEGSTPKSEAEVAVPSEVGASTSAEPSRPLVSPKPQVAIAAEVEDQGGIKNFATDFLVNPALNRSPRRRPGPSLSPFKQMAKSVGRKSASMG